MLSAGLQSQAEARTAASQPKPPGGTTVTAQASINARGRSKAAVATMLPTGATTTVEASAGSSAEAGEAHRSTSVRVASGPNDLAATPTEWEVESVIGARYSSSVSTGVTWYYLVQWKDWPPSANTWEPEGHLTKVDAELAHRLLVCRKEALCAGGSWAEPGAFTPTFAPTIAPTIAPAIAQPAQLHQWHPQQILPPKAQPLVVVGGAEGANRPIRGKRHRENDAEVPSLPTLTLPPRPAKARAPSAPPAGTAQMRARHRRVSSSNAPPAALIRIRGAARLWPAAAAPWARPIQCRAA